MSLKFGRWQHRIFLSVVLLLLSSIYHPFTLQIVLFSQSQFTTILNRFCVMYKSFFENRLHQTPLLTRQHWIMFKRRRHCKVHDNTVIYTDHVILPLSLGQNSRNAGKKGEWHYLSAILNLRKLALWSSDRYLPVILHLHSEICINCAIWRLNIAKKRFSIWRPSAILNLKNIIFCQISMLRMKICICVPNLIEIGEFTAEIWR